MATEPVPTPVVDAVDPSAKIAEFEAQLKTMGESTSNGLAAIQQSINQLQANPRLAPPVVAQPEKPDFFTDPEAATRATVGPELAQLRQGQLQTQAYLVRQALASSDPKMAVVFKRWGQEVDKIMFNEPLNQQANPRAWQYAAKSVLADHIDEISQSASKGQQFFVEPATSGAVPGGTGSAQVVRTLSDKESKIAKLFGMNDTDYLKRQDEVLAGVQD